MNPTDLLGRIAGTLRQDIGPAVADEYPKTQAFMAAVVLQKLAAQLANAQADAKATHADMAALHADLAAATLDAPLPPAVSAALAGFAGLRDKAALCTLIESLYAERAALGAARFDALLGRIRRTLRADIDRQIAYAG